MVGTVCLCLLSTIAFCLGARSVLALSTPKSMQLIGTLTRDASYLSKKVLRGYLIFALGSLTLLAFVGIVVSYIELFGAL